MEFEEKDERCSKSMPKTEDSLCQGDYMSEGLMPKKLDWESGEWEVCWTNEGTSNHYVYGNHKAEGLILITEMREHHLTSARRFRSMLGCSTTLVRIVVINTHCVIMKRP